MRKAAGKKGDYYLSECGQSRISTTSPGLRGCMIPLVQHSATRVTYGLRDSANDTGRVPESRPRTSSVLQPVTNGLKGMHKVLSVPAADEKGGSKDGYQ